MIGFGEKLAMLCEESNMQYKDVALSIGLSQGAISRYVAEDRAPKADILVDIANFFGVSTDWLLGLSDHRNNAGYVSCDDLLEYCEQARKVNMALRSAVVDRDYQKAKPAHEIARDVEAEAFFEREILRWQYDIPRMIHDVASGEWKE